MQTSLTCDLPSTSCFSSAICSAPSVMKKASIFRNLGELMCVECPCIHLFGLGRYILIVLILTSSFVFSSSKIKCFKNCNTTWKYPQENELTLTMCLFSLSFYILTLSIDSSFFGYFVCFLFHLCLVHKSYPFICYSGNLMVGALYAPTNF